MADCSEDGKGAGLIVRPRAPPQGDAALAASLPSKKLRISTGCQSGVNFSQTTAVFAKLDVTFGEDLTGVGGKAGMRVNW